MRYVMILIAAAALASAGCRRTKEGDVVIERPGDVDVKMKQDTINVPTVGTVKDSVTTPVVGTQKETLIVNKPVIGTKKTEIKRPTVHR